ncbi:MAG: hypothetical protein KJ623_01445 [Nanoarchaeota archaeon]|nr:hypothetical protein [Nanoarchaeota archaeon]MBU0962860.1 hypothetical protein [Nanoarchaeota archaeon]
MKKSTSKRDKEKAIKSYFIRQIYEGFPDGSKSQRQLVKFFYDFLWGNGLKIKVEDAKDVRIHAVSHKLWDESKRKDLIDMLTEDQKNLLQHEVEYKRTGCADHGERVGIMLDSQYSSDPEFSEIFEEMVKSQKYKNLSFY